MKYLLILLMICGVAYAQEPPYTPMKGNYKLIGMELPEQGQPEVAFDYYSGVVEIPAAVIQQWGASDDVIWSYVGSQLNLVFV